MNWLNKGDYIRVIVYDRNLNEKAMKNLKKSSYRMLFFAFAFALALTAGVIVSNHKVAYAQGGVEDTWYSDLGDCTHQRIALTRFVSGRDALRFRIS